MEVFLSVEEVWMYLQANKEEYKDEIYWIKTQWYHRFNGKWYFIKGKPTFLNGWHWYFLNYYYLLTGKLPEYRDRDRRWFIVQEYLYNPLHPGYTLEADFLFLQI